MDTSRSLRRLGSASRSGTSNPAGESPAGLTQVEQKRLCSFHEDLRPLFLSIRSEGHSIHDKRLDENNQQVLLAKGATPLGFVAAA